MICELARIVHPGKRGHRYMAVFTFKFDESYNNRTLVIGGWIAEEGQWRKLQRQWRRAIADVNRMLPRGKKISRYHAAHMNANDGEFKGWEDRQDIKIWFTQKLFRIVGNDFMTAVSCGVDLKAFCELFPLRDPPDYGVAYTICMQLAMALMGESLERHPKQDRVAIIHDHGNWDVHALNAYNVLVDDTLWEYRHRFVSITPLTWQEDTGLQSSDMVAYECMRLVDNELWTAGKMRKAMGELLKHNSHIYTAYIDRETLAEVKKGIDEGRFKNVSIVMGLERDERVRGMNGQTIKRI